MSNFNDFEDLAGTGFEDKQPVAPEDEKFHCVYIAGKMRKNHIGIVEKPGLMQVRGIEYNLETVNMIITHVKQILCKEIIDDGKATIQCFSFQDGVKPWYGTSGNVCGSNSTERSVSQYCKDCRAELIVSGIYTDVEGNPIKNDKGETLFVFVRGKGIKYQNVSEYLGKMSRLDLPPIFKPPTSDSKNFEKAVVNNKRFVTQVSITTAPSKHGEKMVFSLTNTVTVPDAFVLDILKISKCMLDEFNNKFNWSKNKGGFNPIQEQKPVTNDDAPSKIPEHLNDVKNNKENNTSKLNEDITSFKGTEFNF